VLLHDRRVRKFDLHSQPARGTKGALRARAEQHHRSLGAEAREILAE
jgi:plasmid stability protein